MTDLRDLMKKSAFKWAVLFLVLIFTFILRAHNYDRVPEMGNLEEMLYGWSGIYLIETGTPVSWSNLDYPKSAKVFTGKIGYNGGEPLHSVDLYKPWLDEPPLYSLMVGEVEHLSKLDRTQIIPSSINRLPQIFFALLTSILVFVITRRMSGFWVATLATLLYGTVPIIVFSSRLAVPENLIALLFLVTIYLLMKFQEKPKFIWLSLIPLIAGVAGLSKPTGFFIIPLAVYIALTRKYFKSVGYLVLTTIPFVIAFVVYGFHYDTAIFKHIVSIQGFRPVGFSSLAFFFTTPAFGITTMMDSWFVFCLLSAAFFIFNERKGSLTSALIKNEKFFLVFSFVYWVIIVMLSGGQQDLLPWYRFPSYPLLAIFGAWGVFWLWERRDFLASFMAVGFFLGSRTLLVNAFHSDISPSNYREILGLTLIPSLFENLSKNKIWPVLTKAVLIVLIVVGLYFNVVAVYNRYDIDCEQQSCPLGPSTVLSQVYFPVVWRLFTLR